VQTGAVKEMGPRRAKATNSFATYPLIKSRTRVVAVNGGTSLRPPVELTANGRADSFLICRHQMRFSTVGKLELLQLVHSRVDDSRSDRKVRYFSPFGGRAVE
jgi:hypothetical protein